MGRPYDLALIPNCITIVSPCLTWILDVVLFHIKRDAIAVLLHYFGKYIPSGLRRFGRIFKALVGCYENMQ